MCGSIVGIQSARAERSEEKRRYEEETTGQNIMFASATQGGHNKTGVHIPSWEGAITGDGASIVRYRDFLP